MKKIVLTILLFGLFSINQQADAQHLRFDARQYVDEEGDTLNYRISFPDFSGSEIYPVSCSFTGPASGAATTSLSSSGVSRTSRRMRR